MEANKVILNGEVIVDLTGDTAKENDVQLGKTFHKADGTLAEGTYVPEVQPLNVSANGTYEPSGSIVGYAPVVVNVEGSGGGTVPKEVNFYDYDGTLLYAYTAEEAKSLVELPPLPEHAGLVCQGWNYTLEYLQNNDASVAVGAMYITDDGATRLYLHFDGNERLTQPLVFAQSVASGVSVDWGDGSEYDTSTSTGTVKLSHTYAEGNRDYVIRLLRVKSDCEITFPSQIFDQGNSSAISTRLFKVEMGIVGKRAFGSSVFRYCVGLETITLPNNITLVASYALCACFALKCVVIPDGVAIVNSYMCYFCHSLLVVSIPDSATSIGNDAFGYCFSLTSVNIPNGVTSIGDTAFYECYSLTSVNIPNGVTSISNNMFYSCYSLTSVNLPNGLKSISNNMFNYCHSLMRIDIPDSVTSIGGNAFGQCTSLSRVVVKAITPPTLQSSSFTKVPSDCIIEVPAESLDSYKTATNWSTYANQIVAIKEES